MMRIKSNCVAYIIVFSLLFTFLLFGCAENVIVQKPVNVASVQNVVARKPMTVASADIKQTIKKEAATVKEDTETR